MKKSFLLEIVAFFCTLVISCACTARPYATHGEDVLVKGDKIYLNGKLYAELRYFRDGICVRGLAIYYHKTEEEVWINPHKGWQVYDYSNSQKYSGIFEVQRICNSGRRDLQLLLGDKAPSKDELISSCSFDIKIGGDGKYVYYKTRGIFLTKSHKFSVEEKSLEP